MILEKKILKNIKIIDRKKFLKLKPKNKTEEVIFELLKYCFPVIYLENYLETTKFVKNKFHNKDPKFVFTSNEFQANEFFKFFVANYILGNNKNYFVSQHGSKYGSVKIEKRTPEEITATKFLTWGWKKNNNHIKTSLIRTTGMKKINSLKKINKIILIFENLPDNNNSYDSRLEFFKKINESKFFIKNLPRKLQKKIVIRPHYQDLNSNYFEYEFKKINPKILIDKSSIDIINLARQDNFMIFFYYSTGFLELLSLNRFSYVFCNLKKDEYIYDFYKDISKLKNKIFFDNSKLLAKKVVILENNLNKKFFKVNTNEILKKFKKKYAEYDYYSNFLNKFNSLNI